MLRQWKLIASLGLTAVGAAAAGIAVLLQKLPKEAPQEGSAAPAAKPKARRTGVYSFISGFQDAATVELSLDYDPDVFSFAIVEDEFLNYSGDSHVAILYGTDFNLQLEYASYYSGENFDAHAAALRARYGTRGDFACGALTGLWVLDGEPARHGAEDARLRRRAYHAPRLRAAEGAARNPPLCKELSRGG